MKTRQKFELIFWRILFAVLLFTVVQASAGILNNIKAFWHFGDDPYGATYVDTSGRGNHLSHSLFINACTIDFRMGRNSSTGTFGINNPQTVYGALKGWGRWNRLLNSTEKAALLGKEYWPFSTTASLNDVLVYFLLDEAGGSTTYTDATGRGNNLTATGTTVQVTGPTGSDYATDFNDGIYLTKTSPGTDLQSRNENTTVAGWVKLDAKPKVRSSPQQVFWGQLNIDTGISGLNVYYDPTADRFALDVEPGDGVQYNQGGVTLVEQTTAPVIGTWYLIICEVNKDNYSYSISVNNGTPTVLNVQPFPIAGKIGNGTRFIFPTIFSFPEHISGWDSAVPTRGVGQAYRSPNADVSIGNNSKTVWGWFRLYNSTVYQTIAGFYGGSGTTTDWIVQQTSNVFYWVFGKEIAYASVLMTDTTSWHLFVGWFDKTANRIYLNIDHGALTANAAGPAHPQTVSGNLIFGADASGANHQFTGSLNAWGIADGTPTQADLDTLWNNGNGWVPSLYFPRSYQWHRRNLIYD